MTGSAASSSQEPSSRVRLVVFDMDGTLTRPILDFDVIRREIGLPTNPRTPILEALQTMAPEERARAEAILHRYERNGAEASELQPGAREVVDAIRASGVPVALLTRNSRQSLTTVVSRHGLQFDLMRARDEGPVKPSADAVLSVCDHFDVPPRATWCIGDYLFDVQSANAAGATSVLMIGDAPPPDYASQARHVIRRLTEVLDLMLA